MHRLVFPAGARVAAALLLAFLPSPARAATSTAESPVFTVDLTGTPLLAGFTKTLVEDASVAFTIGDFTASYLDPESGGLTSIRIESLPAFGALKLSGTSVANGQVIPRASIPLLTYEPAPNDSGLRTFLVSAFDGGLSSAPATVTLSITALADPPTLSTVALLSGASEDSPFTLSYEALQTAADEADPDGDVLSFRIESVSSGILFKGGVSVIAGQTLLAPGETLTWTPGANASGTVSAFAVRAWDGAAASPTAVPVRIQVAPVNDVPTLSSIAPLSGAVEDNAFTLAYATLLAATNAADPDGDVLSFRIETVQAGSLTKGGANVSPGTTLFSPGESLVWTPAANAHGAIGAFTIRAWDGSTLSTNTLEVVISVQSVNDLPTLSSIAPLSGASEDVPFAVTHALLSAASDAADLETNPVAFRLETLTSGTLTKGGVAAVPGATVLGPGEVWTWSPSANANGTIAAFTVRAWDGTAASAATLQVFVQVAAVSDPPTLSTIATLPGGFEDTPFAVTHAALLAASNASDLEGDALSFRLEGVTTGTLTKNGAAVTAGNTLLAAGETWLWTPAANTIGNLNAFTVSAWDGTSASSTPVQVRVTVGATNDPPSLTTIAVLTGAAEDAAFTVSHSLLAAAANTSDPEGDPISFRVAGLTSGTLTKGGNPVVAGTTLLGAEESLVWTPAPNAFGNLNAFTVTAWDGQLASSVPVQVVVAAAPVNDAPSISAVNPLAGALEDTAFTLSHATLAAAADATDPEGDPVSFRVDTVLAGTLTKNGLPAVPGTTVLASGETLVWKAALNAHGMTSAFTVRAWDGAAASSTAVPISISVLAVNDAPELTAVAPLTGASVDSPYAISYAQLRAAANVSDVEGDAVSFRLEGVTAGQVVKDAAPAVPGTTLLRAGETWIWNPPAGLSGTLNAFTVRAWDGAAASPSSAGVQISVANLRIVTQPRAQSLALGAAASLTVTASGTGLTYQWHKAGTPIAGATNASFSIPSFAAGDAAIYHVAVTGSGITLRSAEAPLSVLADQLVATHALNSGGYLPGGSVTITSTISYPGSLSGLGWSVLLPTGWTFAGDGGSAGETRPAVGTTELLEWAWTAIPPSPITFTYTVNVPAGETGARSLTALVVARGLAGSTGPQQVLANPEPLAVPQLVYHDADTSRDFRLSLLELTRVIELYNTRNASLRTGAYAVAATATEDGFVADSARVAQAVITLTRYHSADTNRDGRFSLLELTRVIEIYNFRASGTRTGQYRRENGTEDGFSPGT